MMAAISKPMTNAFMIKDDKVKDFFATKTKTSIDAINRICNRKKPSKK